MSIKRILAHFSAQTQIPVEIEAVANQVKAHGTLDTIVFLGVDVNEKRMKGAFFEYSRSPGVYAQPEFFAEIYYVSTMSLEWQRLVCCKELLHLLDKEPAKSGDEGQISDLISSLCSGDRLHTEDDIQTFADRLMVYYAMAILLPYAVRERLLPDFRSGKISAETIAVWAKIPSVVVSIVMSDKWPAVHSLFNGAVE